jgi:hypothetical protein
MFGKLRRARRADAPAARTATTLPMPGRIPQALYMRAATYHTATKAAISRLHAEHFPAAGLNNAAPLPHSRTPASSLLARAASTAAGRATVVIPPAMHDTLGAPVKGDMKGEARWGSSSIS